MTRNLIEKIWDAHVVTQATGHPAILAIDLMLIHEVTSAPAFQLLAERNLGVFDRSRLLATLDHSIPSRQPPLAILDPQAQFQVDTLRRNCQQHAIPLCDLGTGSQGIVHVIGPERGLTQPGMTIVCGDSHTSTHGAFGALAFGIGTSEVGHVLATGCLLQEKPATMRVELRGEFGKGVFAKDAILKLIAQIGVAGASGHVIEYCGEAIRHMSMEERMTICNMSIECGARAGLIAPDATTLAYLQGRPHAPQAEAWDRAVAYWKQFTSDDGCHYDREAVVALSNLKPMVTWGTHPGQACEIDQPVPGLESLAEPERLASQRAFEYMALAAGSDLQAVPIDWAFIGSCTNGRIEDLRAAAHVLAGKTVYSSVRLYIVPGSEQVFSQAEREGLLDIFQQAGAELGSPGCSMCLAMNGDRVPSGARCISSTNRNFLGRQGPGSRTHLASPATVAASAIAGRIASPEKYF